MYLLDTDILIYALKNDPVVKGNFIRYKTEPKALSVVSYGELYYGAEKSEKPLQHLVKVRRIRELFPVIEVSTGIMAAFGSLKAQLEKKGTRLDDFDLIIASTALALNYTLVSNNEKHFKRVPGLSCANWTKK